MVMEDKIEAINLDVGDIIKYTKSGSQLANGIKIQMKNNTQINVELSEDKKQTKLTVLNTMIKIPDAISDFDKEQLNDLILALREMYRQMNQ